MKKIRLFYTLAALMALASCSQQQADTFNWDSQDQIEYAIDYTVSFAADHDSTLQATATGNYGTVEVVQLESENMIDTDGKPIRNTFIILEDSVPMGKSITLNRGYLSYGGESPQFPHVQTVGSDDMVEILILDTDTRTLYSIRDGMFYGPDEQQTFTIPGGSRFLITLPIMAEERFPKTKETHSISIAFTIADSETK